MISRTLICIKFKFGMQFFFRRQCIDAKVGCTDALYFFLRCVIALVTKPFHEKEIWNQLNAKCVACISCKRKLMQKFSFGKWIPSSWNKTNLKWFSGFVEAPLFAWHVTNGIHVFMVRIANGVLENVLYTFQLKRTTLFLSNDNWTQRHTMSLRYISSVTTFRTVEAVASSTKAKAMKITKKKVRHQIRWMAMVIAGIRMRFVLFMSASMAFWLVKWDAVLIKLHFYVRQNGNNPCNDGHHYYFIFEWEMSNSEKQRWTVKRKKGNANT